MSRLLGIDFETTSLDTQTCSVIEIGMAVLDTKSKSITTCHNFLTAPFKESSNLSPEIISITGITDQLRRVYGVGTSFISATLGFELACADFVVAHNAFGFEDPILRRLVSALDLQQEIPPWIDTMIDIKYNSNGSRSLTYLAADHGFLNPFPHRALFDVITMFQVMTKYDLNEIMTVARTPLVHLRAKVTFDQKDLAKLRGYRWDPVNSYWIKTIRSAYLDEEMRDAPFDIMSLPGYKSGEKYR